MRRSAFDHEALRDYGAPTFTVLVHALLHSNLLEHPQGSHGLQAQTGMERIQRRSVPACSVTFEME